MVIGLPKKVWRGACWFAQLPIMYIELLIANPMMSVMALQKSALEDQGVCRSYLKIWRKIVTGSEAAPAFPLGIAQAAAAFITSPLGVSFNLLVIVTYALVQGWG
ncbi:hypothetical protein [Pseudomonas putida]|uniref:Uncharacterized protein n=1 Tax=Pseudomonas putida TaxID=303 RepID=A0A8I1JII8_PSEPU|nr:hypothetical protein [Pseudomonas putida]MBI6882564.1 hypothetical protein [Pseudomonas putida]